MPVDASPSLAGSSPVQVPRETRLPDVVDLSHSPTTERPLAKVPFPDSPAPSLTSLILPPAETSSHSPPRMFIHSAAWIDIRVEEIDSSLLRYHTQKVDGEALLRDYGLHNGVLPARPSEFQEGLLAVLVRWTTPHNEGIWLSSLRDEIQILIGETNPPTTDKIDLDGRELYTLAHAYLVRLGHIILGTHQVLHEISILKDDPHAFVFDPEFRCSRMLDGCDNVYQLTATWGVLIYRIGCAYKRIEAELLNFRIVLGQLDNMSLKTFDSTITDVRESFLRNSPRTNVLQLLRREDYRKGIPETVKEPVRLWLRGLKEPDTNASLPVYRSELRAPSTGPNILPSITTPQVHFATKPPVVHVPGYGSVQDTQGVSLISSRSRRARPASAHVTRQEIGGPMLRPLITSNSLPPSPTAGSPVGSLVTLPHRTASTERRMPTSSYLQGPLWAPPPIADVSSSRGNRPSSARVPGRRDEDNRGRSSTRAGGKPFPNYDDYPGRPPHDNPENNNRGLGGNGPGGTGGNGPGGNGPGRGGGGPGDPGGGRGGGHGPDDNSEGDPLPGGPYNLNYPPRRNGPPPDPNDPDGGYDPPDPPAGGRLPSQLPRANPIFQWQINSKIPWTAIPEWDGDATTVIQYVSELSYYQQLGDDVTNHLARVAPFRFSGLAKTWFNGLPVSDRMTCTSSMTNFLIFIREQFMHDEWRHKRGLEFDRMYFRRGKEFKNELPLEWVLRRISYARLLYPEEAEFEAIVCSRVLSRRPRSWGTYILTEHSQTIRELLERVSSEQPRLLYAWEQERKEILEKERNN